MEIFIFFFVISIFFGIKEAIYNYIEKKVENKIKSKLKFENRYKENELNNYKISLDNYKKEIEQYRKQVIDDCDKQKKEIEQIINEACMSFPWLVKKIADYNELKDNNRINYLLTKNRPAPTAAEIINEIKKEKKDLLIKYKTLEYETNTLFSLFPWLEDAIQLNINELKDSINDLESNTEYKTEYDTIKQYLSPEEYQKLSNIEKYQLALDRYLKRKKTLWQIGISYERYIGYIYENKGYKVIYNGALKGLKDLGRDIVAENKDEILIIQCKYWKKERFIRENTIFQLYGTMILKQLETDKKVKGILVTTTSLSKEAKDIANYLHIQFRENEIFDKSYPCIKCNINRISNEKIYHLPFDQQYDHIQIEIQKGERYLSTVQEAENLGYRRAKTYYASKK